MQTADILELHAYDRWANARALGLAATLDDEGRNRPSAASYGSVFGTLVHILWSEWVWLGRWTRVTTSDPRPLRRFQELQAAWAAFELDQGRFLSGLTDADLGRPISYQNPSGTTWTYSLQHMIQHVFNHSSFHRGQLITMFRELGITPLPLDFLVYFDEIA